MHMIRLHHIAALMALGLLAGCTTSVTSPVSAPVTTSTATRDLATVQQAAAMGQLFCKEGPAVLAMFDASGAAILAKGAAAVAVNAVCSLVGGAAVALQNVSVTPLAVQVQLPPTVSIPTQPVG